MNDELKREQLLHKIIAASGFVFALCILPVAQHFLIQGQSTDNGSVAGASTDTSITNADIPQGSASASACEAQKEKDLADLQTFSDGKKQALLRGYQSSVQAYIDAETKGGMSDTEKAALDKLINDQYAPYIKSLSEVEDAVTKAQNDITNRSCTASPTASTQAQ